MTLTQDQLNIILKAKDQASGEINKVRNNISKIKQTAELARKAVTVSLATIVSTVGSAAKSFMKLEEAISNVQTMSDMSFKTIEKNVVNLSNKYGRAATDLASATYDIVSAGYDAKKAFDILEASTKGSIVGNADVATTTSATLTILRHYRDEIENVDDVQKVMFAGVEKGRVTLKELATDIGGPLNAAKAFGEELNTVMMTYAMGTQIFGGKSAEVSTMLESVYEDLREKSDLVEKAGIKIYDSQGNFKGLLDILTQINKVTESKSVKEINTYMNSLGLTDRANALLIGLVNNFDEYKETIEEIGNSSFEEKLKQKMSTLHEAWNRFFQSAINSFRRLGGVFAGNFTKILDYLTEGVQKIGEWIKQNEVFVRSFVSGIAKILSATLGILMIPKAIALIMNPVTWLMIGITLLAAAWALNWNGIRDTVKNTWESMKQWLNPLKDTIEGLISLDYSKMSTGFKNLEELASKSNTKIDDFVVDVIKVSFDFAYSTIENVKNLFSKLSTKWSEYFSSDGDKYNISGLAKVAGFTISVGTIFFDFGTSVLSSIDDLINKANDKVSELKDLLSAVNLDQVDLTEEQKAFLESAKRFGKTLAKTIGDAFLLAFNLVDLISEAINVAITKLTGSEGLGGAGETIAKAIPLFFAAKWAVGTLAKLSTALKGIFTGMGVAFSANGALLPLTILSVFLLKGIEDAKEKINEFNEMRLTPNGLNLMEEGSPIQRLLKESFDKGDLRETQKEIANELIELSKDDGILSSFKLLAKELQLVFVDAINDIKDFFSETFDKLASKYKPTKENIGAFLFGGNISQEDLKKAAEDLYGGHKNGSIPKFSTGAILDRQGLIHGPGTGTSDSILARVSAGEAIINAKSTKRYRSLLKMINEGTLKLPQFNTGTNFKDINLKELEKYSDIPKNYKNILVVAAGKSQDTESFANLVKAINDLINPIKDLEKNTKDQADKINELIGSLKGIDFKDQSPLVNYYNAMVKHYEKEYDLISKKADDFQKGIGPKILEIAGRTWKEKQRDVYNPETQQYETKTVGLEMNFDFIGELVNQLMKLQNVMKIIDFIGTIFDGFFSVVGPLINNALMPFVNILTNLGKMFGTLLLPILEPILGGFQALGIVLTWIYNNILNPIAKGLYVSFGFLANGFNILYNSISWFVNKITFGVIDMGKRAVKSMDQLVKEAGEKFQEIDIKKQDEYNTEYKSSVTRSGPETVNNTFIINANDSFIQDSTEKFKTYIFKLIKEYEKESGLKFAT
jgi:TP901 family phage tail tape measure protein